MKILKNVVKTIVAIFILFALYIGAAHYQVYSANKKAGAYCDLAIVGESFEVYKKKVRENIDKNKVFDDKKLKHGFSAVAPFLFGSMALCTIKTDGAVIISKEFIPTFGGS